MNDDNKDLMGVMDAVKTIAPAILIGSLWALSWANLRADLTVLETKLTFQQETLQDLREEIRTEFTRRRAMEDGADGKK